MGLAWTTWTNQTFWTNGTSGTAWTNQTFWTNGTSGTAWTNQTFWTNGTYWTSFFLGLLFSLDFFSAASLDFLGLFFWLIGFFVFRDLKVILGEFDGDQGFFGDFLDFFC